MNKNSAFLLSLAIVFVIAVFMYTNVTSYNSLISGDESQLDQSGLNNGLENSMAESEISTGKTTENKLTTKDILNLKTFRFTNVDGKLQQDADGHLIINRDLRYWIDFYLSATGEASLEDLIGLMKSEIALLDSPAKEQALEILLSYIGYKTALADYDERESLAVSGMSSIEQVGDRLEWQKRLRREWLPAEAVDEFWQLDEIIDDYAYQKLVITNSDLTLSEKEQKISELEQQLPQEFTEFKKSVTLSKDLMAKENELIEQGRSDEIQQLREESLSPEAVERLDMFDQKQENWRTRVVDYRNQLQEIESLEGVSNVEKEELIKEYQSQYFDTREALRLPAAVQLIDAELQ